MIEDMSEDISRNIKEIEIKAKDEGKEVKIVFEDMAFKDIVFEKIHLGRFILNECGVCGTSEEVDKVKPRIDFEMVMCEECFKDFRSGGKGE